MNSRELTLEKIEKVKEVIKEFLEKPFHTFAEEYGFSLKEGDIMIAPKKIKGIEIVVPHSLQKSVKISEHVNTIYFLRRNIFN